MPPLICAPSRIRRILFECNARTQADIAPFSAALPAHWFETVEGVLYLSLTCDRGKYTPIRNDQVDRGKYRDSIIGSIAPLSTSRIGFQLAIDRPEADILYVLERIKFNQASEDLKRHIPIRVIDFVRPEFRDRRLSSNLSQLSTQRVGRIVAIEESGGMVSGASNSLIGGSLTISFECKDKVLLP